MAQFGPKLILGLINLILVAGNGINDCPIACFCDTKNVDSIPGGQGLRINCHPDLSVTGSFDIRLPTNTIQLDLSKYGIRQIKAQTFAGLVHLKKLDLQGNKIQHIEDGAFRNLPKLEVLDLSRNSLKNINKETLAGLVSLYRLKLADNNIQTVEDGSFGELRSLEKIDISDNPLVCDCGLEWFAKWFKTNLSKFVNSVKVKCGLPISLADKPIKDVIDSICSSDKIIEKENNNNFNAYSKVNLSPSNAQVVYEGDELSFHCQNQQNKLQWLINDNPLSAESDYIRITNAIGHSVLSISKLVSDFKGKVTCRSSSDGSQASVDILVLPNDIPVCNPIVLETSRGKYRWSSAVTGTTLRQWCQRKPNHHEAAEASLQCRQTGEWAAAVNVSECAYTSDVTDTLHKFATMNTSFTMKTLLESANHFLNYTSNPSIFQSPMDVVYFSQAVENYLPYLTESNEVGHHMMDMVANILGVSPKLMSQAQKHGLAGRRLLNVMENITSRAVPIFRHGLDSRLAMETFSIKPLEQFDGISCSWYVNGDTRPYSPKRVFHCVQSNSIQAVKQLLVSVVIPASLYNQIDYQLIGVATRIMFAAFDNSSLFPSNLEVTQVIGCKFLGAKRNLNLTDPVLVSINLDPVRMKTHEVTPVVWDQFSNGGFGGWTTDYCQKLGQSTNLVKFTCSRIGYYGLRYDLNKSDQDMYHSKWHHPMIYVSGGISGILIVLTLVIFASKRLILSMAYEMKHALLNTWITSCIQLYFYIFGIYQVGNETTCRIVAFLLHHLLISSLLWLLTGVYIIYCKVSAKKKSPLDTGGARLLVRGADYGIKSDPDQSRLLQDKKPLIRYYFFAYGVPTLIVIVTASTAGIDNYQNDEFCYLTSSIKGSMVPFIGGVVVPCVLISTVMIGFGLSVLCVLSTSPYKVTETENDAKANNLELLDGTKSPKQMLFSLSFQFFMLSLCYISAGIQLVFPQYSTLLSVAVSISLISYGGYIMATFCIFRSDVCGIKTGYNQRLGTSNNYSPDNEDITANLVELCPRPLPTTNSSERTSSLRPIQQVKDINVARDVMVAPTCPSLFGPSSLKVNNINIHPGMAEKIPKTSSPANSHIPQIQDITGISPMVAAEGTEPYSIVPLTYKQKPEISIASVNTGISYTDSSTIRMGVPCDMATFDFGQPSSTASLIGTGTPKRLFNFGPSSSSLPRSLRQPPGNRRTGHKEDILETQSKLSALSIGSSRSGHSRSGKKRHKKPTRRRPRQPRASSNGANNKHEPVYNNVVIGEDVDYNGDDDQFDTLERQRRTIALPDELPSVIHEDGDEDEDEIVDDDALSQPREEPASLEDLPSDQFDMPKRETSV